MLNMHYVGLDIHKKSISYCVRQSDGTIVHECPLLGRRLTSGSQDFPHPGSQAWKRPCLQVGYTII